MELDLRIFCVVFIFVFSGVDCFPIFRQLCDGMTLEQHEEHVPIVVSAHVLSVTQHGNRDVIIDSESVDNVEYTAVLQIKRVFKGNDLVSTFSPSRPENRLFSNYNKRITVLGFHYSDDYACKNDVNKGDTKIFFLEYSEGTEELFLHPPIVPLSLYHLDRVGAAVKGRSLLVLCSYY